ncbi:hypothetical protein [Parasitella parasitica]|uniref:Tc1-like transposase DDE domain-containing protein n=1 Tax=Parasitella parasitica TaxID=35722 RepID=A0A0B7N4X7_9FUNG|nr:hypothetical protein [Parasitella parasitica]
MFYFEDGLGNVVDENGVDPMDITEDEDPFKLEELTSYTKGNRVSNEIKARAVHLVDIHPKNSARAVALSLKLEPRTVQRWYKSWKEDPDSLFPTIGRPRIIDPEGELAEATKAVVTDLYFNQPTSTIDQLMDRLKNSFEDLSISKRTLHRYMADLWIFTLKRIQLEPLERNTPERIQSRKEWVQQAKEMGVDYMNNCVFIDEAGFNANLRRTQGWAPKGQTPIVKVLTARANSISILGATSARGLIKVSLRKPVPPSKKRKLAGGAKQQTKGTVTNHYVNFISDIMNEMDKFPEMKGSFLIMDNAPIHTNKIIKQMIEERDYRCIYLPAYSPELNPIEQFWSVVKSGVKREFILKKDIIPQIIADASNRVSLSSFEGFARHSVKRFDDCLAGLPI